MSASALYEGTTRHHRRQPRGHRFRHPLLMVALDHDELGALTASGGPLDEGRRAPWIRYERRDYLDGDPDTPLDEAVRDLVEHRTGARPTGPVRTLTQLRTGGFVFNPLTVHHCTAPGAAPGDAPEVVVLEVTNTPWRERHCYVIDARPGAVPREHHHEGDVALGTVDDHGRLHAELPKALHVSPFMGMDQRYRLSCTGFGDRAWLQLQTWTDGDEPELVFDATYSLTRSPLDRRTLRRALRRRPLAPLRAWLAIHAHAVVLTAKRVPFVRHPGHQPTRTTSSTGAR